MASHDTGYENELFQQPTDRTLRCGICLNLLRDPVSCQQNEHLFCRACITGHLTNSQTCPSCMKPLTVESLSQAPQAVTNLLSQQAAAACSNEGCQLVVSRQDLEHHETAVCELPRVQCHSCDKLKQEMDKMKGELAAMNEKLKRVMDSKIERVEIKEDMETFKSELAVINKKVEKTDERTDNEMDKIEKKLENVRGKAEKVAEQVQEKVKAQEKLKLWLLASHLEMKIRLEEVTEILKRIKQQSPHRVQSLHMNKHTARESKIVVAAGWNGKTSTNSVEMFSFVDERWTLLQPMKEARQGASSVVYNNHIFILGGFVKSGATKSIEQLSLNAVHVDQTVPWDSILAELPQQLWKHCSVLYKARLIVIGGYDESKRTFSDSITEISLVSPYTSKLLAVMPEKRWYHGVALLGDKILILGGKVDWHCNRNLLAVLLYDINSKECEQLAPLPYPVSEMATVKLDDENVFLGGGIDSNEQALNKALLYNIRTQKSYMLPDMKYKRVGCVAAVVRDNLIVMGGRDERGNYLKSVESFEFDRNIWVDLPEMHEARCLATTVVC